MGLGIYGTTRFGKRASEGKQRLQSTMTKVQLIALFFLGQSHFLEDLKSIYSVQGTYSIRMEVRQVQLYPPLRLHCQQHQLPQ